MGGKQASETLLSIKLQQMEKGGKHVSENEQNILLNQIQSRYEKETDPYYAAARLWVDGIVDPVETRDIISLGIAAANNNADIPQFNPGIIQV